MNATMMSQASVSSLTWRLIQLPRVFDTRGRNVVDEGDLSPDVVLGASARMKDMMTADRRMNALPLL